MAKIRTVKLEDENSRQSLIDGWGVENQEKLKNTNVLLLGSKILGQMILGCLSAMKFGGILVMDNTRTEGGKKDFLFPNLASKGIKKINRIVKTANAINSESRIKGIHGKFHKSYLDLYNFKPNIIIDAQNNPYNKYISLDYAIKSQTPYISAFCNKKQTLISILNEKKDNMDEIINTENLFEENLDQGNIPSGVAAGIVVDEARKSVFLLEDIDLPLEKRIVYNLESKSRNSLISDFKINTDEVRYERALVAGAGAIGNYVALNLALSGFKYVDVIDNDHVDATNLERQILFYDSIGDSKSEILLKRMQEIGRTQGEFFIDKITENSRDLFQNNNYNLIFGCFDNKAARYNLSNLAKEFEINYIDGGTSPFSGNIVKYIPGLTACINCQKNLEKSEERASCIERPDPSVVVTNITTGSLMVGEAINILNENTLEDPINFDIYSKERISLSPPMHAKEECNCNI